jgi:hypothetical protein
MFCWTCPGGTYISTYSRYIHTYLQGVAFFLKICKICRKIKLNIAKNELADVQLKKVNKSRLFISMHEFQQNFKKPVFIECYYLVGNKALFSALFSSFQKYAIFR